MQQFPEAAATFPERVATRVVKDAPVANTYGVDHTAGAVAPDNFLVVRARDREDVIEVLQHAQAHCIPVVPQGARTGLTGGAVAIEGGIVLSVEALSTIEIDTTEGLVVAGPGAINADVKKAAALHGLAYPPDPSSAASCSIGGNVATNAGGLCCVKYGVTADYVRGLEVVLAGGEVIRTGRRTRKGVAGYDLTGLFVGSEGTLGVVTEVVARLIAAPDPALTALATFNSLGEATDALASLRTYRHSPSLLEVLDGPSVEAIQAYGDYGFPSHCAAAVLVQSDRPGHTAEDIQHYASLLEEAGAVDVAVADDHQEAEALLEGRKVLNPALNELGKRLVEDVCVPVGRLGDLVRAGHEIAERRGLRITMPGHGGDGNLHPSIFIPEGPDGPALAEAAFDDLVGATLELGGTITGEHGVGTVKAPWLARELGEAEMARQRTMKAVFDPLGIMNPGRVFV
nr:FAD-linked oxidase C-terminal domain-containing protein [Ornithinimicrobium sp. HY1745]